MGKKTIKVPKNAEELKPIEENGQPQLEIDYEGIYAHQMKLEALCENAEQSKTIEYFSKIKYKQNIYQIGEFVHLYEPTETIPYVAKIHSIIRIPTQEIAAIIKVEWLLRKADLPEKYEKWQKHFSVAEVFPSGQFDYILIESIMRKCFVIENSEYEYLQNAGDNIHFSRAVYDNKKGELDPHPSKWDKECYCNTPVNPDLAYVFCEKCQHWIHHDCIKDQKRIEAEVFICEKCKK